MVYRHSARVEHSYSQSLVDAITYAHSIGLKVSLNPHLSSYDGGLVEMPTNLTDYPHKEAEIDYGLWTWNADNQYAMKVIAHDLSDSFLAERAFTITVVH